jgi:hypothetical protein
MMRVRSERVQIQSFHALSLGHGIRLGTSPSWHMTIFINQEALPSFSEQRFCACFFVIRFHYKIH